MNSSKRRGGIRGWYAIRDGIYLAQKQRTPKKAMDMVANYRLGGWRAVVVQATSLEGALAQAEVSFARMRSLEAAAANRG